MKIERITLIFYVICCLVFSIPGLFFSEWFSQILGYDTSLPGSKMEFVAAYGGLIFGIALFLAYCIKVNVLMGLSAVLLIIGSLLVGRVFGYFTESGINNVQIGFLVIESITVAYISVLLLRNRKQQGSTI